jgi:quercetin dioxygenase-like cupin family protein
MEKKSSYKLIQNIADEVQVPADGILSRTMYQDDHLKIVAFGFATGQELSAHTAPMHAVMYFVKGSADLTLGDDKLQAQAGTVAHMDPQLTHGIVAKEPTVMLLYMLKQARE